MTSKACCDREVPDLHSKQDLSIVPLGRGGKGLRGVVVSVGSTADAVLSPEEDELKRRLLEIGFVEGASVEILHEGWFGRDPIAVRLDDMRVALRRREADNVLIRPSAIKDGSK